MVTDLVVDAVLDGDATHAVAGLVAAGLPGDDGTDTLVAALGRLRSAGATGFGAALPVEGDPVGLGGPREFNTAALEAGEAVVVTAAGPGGSNVGLVPLRVGAAITWTARAAERRQLPDVGDADRALRGALLEAADMLARLDVARWRPEVADRLMDLRHRPHLEAPAGVPPRCVDLAARGLQAREIVDLALEDDGGAVSSYEVEARRGSLQPLERAGRRALVAACSPAVWPPAG